MISFKNVTQRYGEQVIFKDVSFDIADHEISIIVGRNGAGKSTLIRTLLGLLPCRKGEIVINGYNIKKSKRWKSCISYLPEKFQLYPQLTIYENLAFFASLQKLPGQEIDQVLELTGMAAHKEKRIPELSKGMLQRVGLSLAFLGNPELIILDEPTSGLDPFGRQAIIKIIKEMQRQGKTIVFSSHHIHEMKEAASSLLFMEDEKLSKITVDSFLQWMHKGVRIV